MRQQPRIIRAGPSPEDGDAVLLLVHGRGASAESMMSLYRELSAGNVSGLAPEAPGNTWYPNSFLAPLESNQPYLDLALNTLETIVSDLVDRGVSSERMALMGFSQGACLIAEFVARFPRHYGGVMALTGGLIGPSGTPRNYEGRLDGTVVFLGSGDPDPHVPFSRVEETASVLGRMGAEVEVRRYPGMAHTINEEELGVCRELVRRVAGVQGAKRP